MNGEVEGMWKEAVMTCLKVFFLYSPERTEENHENLSQNYQYPYRDSKRVPH
jgi:hypothetical protein